MAINIIARNLYLDQLPFIKFRIRMNLYQRFSVGAVYALNHQSWITKSGDSTHVDTNFYGFNSNISDIFHTVPILFIIWQISRDTSIIEGSELYYVEFIELLWELRGLFVHFIVCGIDIRLSITMCSICVSIK